jgi:putative transposase
VRRKRGRAPLLMRLGHAKINVPVPFSFLDWVNEPATEGELQALRRSVLRGSPYGDEDWMKAAAKRLGLEFTLRPRGRARQDKGPMLFQ